MQQKVIKTGNSAAVTIPASFVRDLGIRIGDTVKTKLEPEKGRLVFTFSGAKQLSLSDLHLSQKK
jgi:antitoxin component of MazEF toxin-antitoxin module